MSERRCYTIPDYDAAVVGHKYGPCELAPILREQTDYIKRMQDGEIIPWVIWQQSIATADAALKGGA